MKINQTVISSSPPKWNLIDFKELYNYKDLLYFMVLREVVVLYKQTILGFSWAIIRPLLSMVIFSVIFGKLADIPSDGVPYPIFSYVALVPWIYFSTSISKSSQSLIGSMNIFSKVYFPRLIIPLTPVISGLVDFLISLSIVFFMMIYYNLIPTLNILWLPLLVLIMILTSSGLGMWFSALAIQYRDVRHAIPFIAQILMYSAPVVWPISLLVDKVGYKLSLLYSIYPMVGVIEGFRSALIAKNTMPYDMIIISAVSSIFVFITGSIYFKSKEKYFVDIA